ncbi:hypothetical protein BFW01_g358 [Lasiodiplodia theobromae]|uniref:2-iminobutanoate/2-iminopropanoate deaminase n=1 Tax=Lasiodiplodia theobromae TaxID=45133 RepID=A0A8H7IQY6_9PEZI|nr:hypothetical protein BFW01_g358 [Lasiodiplodia theobromae]
MRTQASAKPAGRATGTLPPSASATKSTAPDKVNNNFSSPRLHSKLSSIAGGFYDADLNISQLVPEQIDQAFVNVDTALRDAGCKGGWAHVFRINSFHIQLDQEAQDAMVRNFKKWMPDNHPVWTCVQVGRLGDDRMRVEIEVSAFDPEGAKEQGTIMV